MQVSPNQNKNFRKTVLAAVVVLAFSPAAYAGGTTDGTYMTTQTSPETVINSSGTVGNGMARGIVINSNPDGSSGEWFEIRNANLRAFKAEAGAVDIYGTTTTVNGPLSVTNATTTKGISNAGDLTQTGATTLTGATGITGTLGVSGNTTLSTLTTTGAATLNSAAITNNATVGGTLGVTGATTTMGITNTGGLAQTGTTTLTGATGITGAAMINTTGNATTTIGNATSATTVGGTLGVTGATTTNGITNTGGLMQTGATSINTASAASTVIGNAANTTSINSATNNIGVNMFATTNNMGTNSAAASTNVIGNANNATTVNSNAGAGYSALNNINATLGTGTGGMVQTDATTATLRASSAGVLASNGSTGAMNIGAGGGYTAYATSYSTGTGTIGGIVDNKSYTNKISGNTYVDGNVYINGTLDYVSSNSANTTVIGGTAATSNLAGATTATTGGTAIMMKGATGTQTVVDANGKLTNVIGTATQSSAALTLTNGIGNTHGLVVTETQASLSGGAHSSTLTMNDNGANFSDSATGAPVQVHGVKDGTSNFDAVNVRQFSSAIAAVTAMANIPQVDQDKTYALGVGLGSFMGRTALAVGGTYRFAHNGVLKSSISSAMNGSKSTTAGVGAAWSY